MNIDSTKIRPIPIQGTLLLVNNFIINTTKFLNTFAETCDTKISKVSSRLNDLEIVLTILEAKLNSIPGLEYTANDLPSATPAASAPQSQENVVPPSSSSSSVNNSNSAVPPPQAISTPEMSSSTSIVISAPDSVPVGEHPDYAEFFKLLRLGVPPPVVKAKLQSAGLDPSYVDTPDRYVPLKAANLPISKVIFNKFDPNGTGSINVRQFQAMAANFGVWLSGESLNLAIKMIDSDGSGTIEYNEFLRWYKQSSFASLSLDDKLLERRHTAALLFSKYDDDKSGVIDRQEFIGLHSELTMKKLTTYSVDKALEDMDMNGDGQIQFNEFVFWLERH